MEIISVFFSGLVLIILFSSLGKKHRKGIFNWNQEGHALISLPQNSIIEGRKIWENRRVPKYVFNKRIELVKCLEINWTAGTVYWGTKSTFIDILSFMEYFLTVFSLMQVGRAISLADALVLLPFLTVNLVYFGFRIKPVFMLRTSKARQIY